MGCTQTKEMHCDATEPRLAAAASGAPHVPPSPRTQTASSARAHASSIANNSKQVDMQPGDAERATESPDRTTASGGSPTSAIDPGMFIQATRGHLSERYVREKKLGSGAYGEVLLCRDKQTGCERAVKIIKKSSVSAAAGTNLLEEVAVVKQLDHPNIMKLYEFFEDKKNYYLVSEVYKGGELFDEIINRQRFTGMVLLVVFISPYQRLMLLTQ